MRKYKTFWKRIVAALIDSVLFFPFAIPDVFFDLSTVKNFMIVEIAFVLLWTVYSIVGNGIYGFTIGKKILGLKVLNLREDSTIGVTRGFLRESVWFFASSIMIIGFALQMNFQKLITESDRSRYEDILGIISIIWLTAELITMITNNKTRAIHDYLANSVVVNIDGVPS